MVARSVLVYEREPWWEPELKRQFLGSDVTVRACRSLKRLTALAHSNPGSVIVLDLGAGADECLRFLSRSSADALPASILVIGSAKTAELEWTARELGAVQFEWDHVGGAQLAKFCRSQLESKSEQRSLQQ